MKTILAIFFMLISTSLYSQTIDIVAPDGREDYSISNEIVNKLRDSRIYQRIGNYTTWSEKKLTEGNLVLEIFQENFNNSIGNNTVILMCKVIKYKNELVLQRLEVYTYTVTGYRNHIDITVDNLYTKILMWADYHKY